MPLDDFSGKVSEKYGRITGNKGKSGKENL